MDAPPSVLAAKAALIASTLKENAARIKKKVPEQQDSRAVEVRCPAMLHDTSLCCASCGTRIEAIKHYLAMKALKSVGIENPTWGQYKKELDKGGSSKSHAVVPQVLLTGATREILDKYLREQGRCGDADEKFWAEHFDRFWARYKKDMVTICGEPRALNAVAHRIRAFQEAAAEMPREIVPPLRPKVVDLALTEELAATKLQTVLENELQLACTTNAVQRVEVVPDDKVEAMIRVEEEEEVMEMKEVPKLVPDPNNKKKMIRSDTEFERKAMPAKGKDGKRLKHTVVKHKKALQAPGAGAAIPLQRDAAFFQNTNLGQVFGPGTRVVTITNQVNEQKVRIHRELPADVARSEENYVPSRAEFLLGPRLEEMTIAQRAAARDLNVVADAGRMTSDRGPDGAVTIRAAVKGRVPSSSAEYVWVIAADGKTTDIYKDTYVDGKPVHRKYKRSSEKLDRVDYTPDGKKVSFQASIGEGDRLERRALYSDHEGTVLLDTVEPIPPKEQVCKGVERIFQNMANVGFVGHQCKLCEEMQGELTLLQRFQLLGGGKDVPAAMVSEFLLKAMQEGKLEPAGNVKGGARTPVTLTREQAEEWMDKWMEAALKPALQRQLGQFGKESQ